MPDHMHITSRKKDTGTQEMDSEVCTSQGTSLEVASMARPGQSEDQPPIGCNQAQHRLCLYIMHLNFKIVTTPGHHSRTFGC